MKLLARNIVTYVGGFGLMLLIGCGPKNELPKTVKVAGKVTYQGQPVANVSVLFMKDKAPSPSSGETNAQGEFVLTTYASGDGAFPGKNKVMLAAKAGSSPTATGIEGADYEKAMKELTEKKPGAEQALSFPKKYSAFETSDLEVTVTEAGPNNHVLELKD